MPQASVAWSRMRCRSTLSLSRCDEQVVHLVLADHRAQRGLRDLAGGIEGVRHLDDGLAGIDDAEVDHRVHLHRHVVARDDVLLGDVEHDDAQVHLAHLLHDREHDDDARALDAGEAPEREHHAALVLVQHLAGR